MPIAGLVVTEVAKFEEQPLTLWAFNWQDPDSPLPVQPAPGWRYENRSTNDIGDYLHNREEVLKKPEFIFRGLRAGAEVYGTDNLVGYCYVARVDQRYQSSESGQPVLCSLDKMFRGTNTFAIYIDDDWQILGTSFMACDWFGFPSEHEFDEVLYNHNGKVTP